MNLILDVKKYIALFDKYTWIKLYLYDEEFNSYAISIPGINMFIETFRPRYITLPNKYKNITRELLPTQTPGAYGRPFFNSPETSDVIYKNKQFLANNIKIEVGDKGYRCLGCSPGSYPRPIIIAAIDHEKGEIGLIYPFVYKENINDEYVTLRVGKDMDDDMDQFQKIHYNIDKHPNVFNISDKYTVCYHNAKYIIGSAFSLDIGSFGNIDLPTIDGKIPYEYL